MRKCIVLLLALLATPAAAQIQRVQGCKSGTTCDPVTVAFSGGGGGGDATAANQTTEIARLTSIVTLLGGGLPARCLAARSTSRHRCWPRRRCKALGTDS